MCFVSMSGNLQEDLDRGTMIMQKLDLSLLIGAVTIMVILGTVLAETNLVGMPRTVMMEMTVLAETVV